MLIAKEYAKVCAQVCDDLYNKAMMRKKLLDKLEPSFKYNYHKNPYTIDLVLAFYKTKDRMEYTKMYLSFHIAVLKDKQGKLKFIVNANRLYNTPSLWNRNDGSSYYMNAYRGWKQDMPYDENIDPSTWLEMLETRRDTVEDIIKHVRDENLVMYSDCQVFIQHRNQHAYMDYDLKEYTLSDMEIVNYEEMSFWEKRRFKKAFTLLNSFSQELCTCLKPLQTAFKWT